MEQLRLKGSDKTEHKINASNDFINGGVRAIISKPSIFMDWVWNWQALQ